MAIENLYAADGTRLAYHVLGGDGPPLVCIPGGPMQASEYLGDLGGLSASHRLIRLDLRGTGQSARPRDTSSYRCDRLVADVEALRRHLGIERLSLLAHSAGANLAGLYAERHPERLARLVLVTPSTFAVGIFATGADRADVVRLRADEPWYAPAAAGFEAVAAGRATDDDWEAIAPFRYGRWDAVAQAHHSAEAAQRNDEAAEAFGSGSAYDPERTRAALATLTAPVLVLSGEVDIAAPPRAMAEYVALFPHVTHVVQPAAGHFPWLDDAAAFTATVGGFVR